MVEVAATISEDRTPVIAWASVGNGDTFGEARIPGGEYVVECTGTFDSAVIDLQYGSVSGTLFSIDTDERPDGARFTTAGATRVSFPAGFVAGTFSTGGSGSEDITLKILPALNNKM